MGLKGDRGGGDAGRGAGSGVGAAAARDHIYRRLEKLGRLILSERGARREEARKERAFLEAELARVLRQGRGTVRLHPELERAIRGKVADPPHTVFPRATAKSQPGTREKAPVNRPPYWASCKKMDFRELREFIDDSLHEPQEPNGRNRPRSKNQFLDLLGLLAGKAGSDVEGTPMGPELAGTAGEKLRRARVYRSGLVKAVTRAQRLLDTSTGGSTRKLPGKIRRLQAELEHAEARIERLEAQRAGGQVAPGTEARKRGRVRTKRGRIVARIRGDIERVFANGGLGLDSRAGTTGASAGARRLPWRVLPPGELSLQRVLAHYEKLGRVRPDVRYEPERIRRAYSLGPDGCYVGSDEFDGYVVFTFPGTKKALLERPVYGNAVYILGPDWKRLSRMSKRELLADGTFGVTRIVHRGDWFLRVVNALGLRR